jgi:hypothetical protein
MKYSDISDADLKSWATGKKATRRLLRRKWNSAIDEQYPDAEEAKKVKAKLYRELEAGMGERNIAKPQVGMGQKGKAFYDAMGELGLTSKSVPISNLEKDYPRIRVANPNASIFTENQRGVMFSNSRIENSYKNYLRLITPDLKEIVIKNVKRIKSQMKKKAADERAAKRSKLITVDKARFIGATDMSKATVRESIYTHWESVVPKYKKVKETLDKLLTEAENTDVYSLMLKDLEKEKAKLEETKEIRRDITFDSSEEEILGPNRKYQAQLLVYQDMETEIKEKAENYKKDLAKLKSQMENANLEYLVKIDRVKDIPYQVDAWDRMLDAIARYEAAEEAVEFQSPKTATEGKVGTDARTSLFESGKLRGSGESSSNVPEQSKTYAVAEMDELLADDVEFENAPENIEDELREIDAALDPLLAIELAENKKLIALNEQSKEVLKEAIEELKEGANLEFVSEADKWLKEIEDSYILDRSEYILPASVYKSRRGNALRIKKLPTALEGFTLDIAGEAKKDIREEPYSEESIISYQYKGPEIVAEWKDGLTPAEDLNNLFDAFHILFTSQRYSFIRYARSQKGAQKTESVSRAEVQRLKRGRSVVAQRKLDSLLNQRPSIPARQGRLISGISDEGVGKALANFIEACNEYYLEPFLSGKTPIAYPKYMSGVGIKALTAIGNELGHDTMLGNVSTKLSRTAGTKITQGTMNALTSFLTLIDEVVVVNEKTIKSAKLAAKALTKIFGKKEENLNTVAAILMYFIEQTRKEDDRDRARDDFEGSTIQARAKKFNSDKVSAYPIFALYPFLEMNQGLLTRTKPMRTQYNKLMKTLTEIDDELPEVLTKLLKAHNTIRKAMGKEVITPQFRANHEGYDGLIDLMYKAENIDLSHLEVENIVKAVDSHSNIGREHGITEEQVYLIKAYVR